MNASKEDVRHRVLLAARAEFAEFGLAGARVDRIAKQAHASKERLYAYFADKAALFQAVLNLNGSEFFDATTLTPAHAADFVGDLFDHWVSNPEHIRMLTWARLDGLDYKLRDGCAEPQQKLEALREGQRLGLIDPSWDPNLLLTLLFSLGLAWAESPDPATRDNAPDTRAAQRSAAVEAAHRLLDPR